MRTIELTASNHETTKVEVVRETEKAILVKGNASEAWFPKAAIDANGNVAAWFQFGIAHCFLWEAPRRIK